MTEQTQSPARYSSYEAFNLMLNDGDVATLIEEQVKIIDSEGKERRESFVAWLVINEYQLVAVDQIGAGQPMYRRGAVPLLDGSDDYPYIKKIAEYLGQAVVSIMAVPPAPKYVARIQNHSVVSHFAKGSLCYVDSELPAGIGINRVKQTMREDHHIKLFRRYTGPANRAAHHHNWSVKHASGRIDTYGADSELTRSTSTNLLSFECHHFLHMAVPKHVNGVYFHFH